MNFLKVTHDGVSSVINLALVIQAGYEQSSQQLHIKFTNGETITLIGEEGERVWMLLSLEAGADNDYDPDEDEAVGDFDIINQEITELENQVKNNSVTRTWDAQRLCRWRTCARLMCGR
jgi:predicted ABC-type transport system involved in lysophospholipase L1 biosynthesis ATPase subunit